MPRRQTDIDTIRAFACIALVSFHVVGAGAGSGMELALDHPLHLAQEVLQPLRMPLFTFLSGLVFAVSVPPLRHWRSKMRRLLVPMVAVGTLFWLVRGVAGYDQPDLIDTLWLPYAHFWYLQATFLIMSVALALLWLGRGSVPLAALGLIVIAAAGQAGAIALQPNVFAFRQALVLAPFFAAGLLWARYLASRDLSGPAFRRVGLVLIAGAVLTGYGLARDWVAIPAILPGLAGCAGLMLLAPRHDGLAALGRSSYAVYLFHVFFTAGTLLLLDRLWPAAPLGFVWIMALAAGLAGPVLVERAALRHRTSAFLLLGLPLTPRPTRPPVRPRGAVAMS